MYKFSENLMRIKEVWAKQKYLNSQPHLKDIEFQVTQLYKHNLSGVFSEEEKATLKDLDRKKEQLLEWEDSKWRMKSTAMFL